MPHLTSAIDVFDAEQQTKVEEAEEAEHVRELGLVGSCVGQAEDAEELDQELHQELEDERLEQGNQREGRRQ
jgi:hypothetical protein